MSPPADGTVPTVTAAVSSAAAHAPTGAPRTRRPSVPEGRISGTGDGPAETARAKRLRAKEALRAARRACGFSQEALADVLDLDRSTVRAWEDESRDLAPPLWLLFDGGMPSAWFEAIRAHVEAERSYYDRSHVAVSPECEAASTVVTSSQLLARIGADLHDGKITPEEAAATLPEVVRQQRQLSALAASLAKRAGGR